MLPEGEPKQPPLILLRRGIWALGRMGGPQRVFHTQPPPPRHPLLFRTLSMGRSSGRGPGLGYGVMRGRQ